MNDTYGRYAVLYARLALGAAFLSAVASRLGLWGSQSSGWAGFLRYTGEVVAFMPARTIPTIAALATIAETSLGLALVLGFRLRWAAPGAALLLALFATAMAVSLGPKSPLDYSVYSASAGALLLALEVRRDRTISRAAGGGVIAGDDARARGEAA